MSSRNLSPSPTPKARRLRVLSDTSDGSYEASSHETPSIRHEIIMATGSPSNIDELKTKKTLMDNRGLFMKFPIEDSDSDAEVVFEDLQSIDSAVGSQNQNTPQVTVTFYFSF